MLFVFIKSVGLHCPSEPVAVYDPVCAVGGQLRDLDLLFFLLHGDPLRLLVVRVVLVVGTRAHNLEAVTSGGSWARSRARAGEGAGAGEGLTGGSRACGGDLEMGMRGT